MEKYTCPVCGYLVFDDPPGSYDICPICFWEDDPVQLELPDDNGGANKVSLLEAQNNYGRLGVVEERLINYVRPPSVDDKKDPQWRPIDPTVDTLRPFPEATDPRRASREDRPNPYYWIRRDLTPPK